MTTPVPPMPEGTAPAAIAQRLRQLRLRWGLGQEQMAERAGVASRTWQGYEAGTAPPRPQALHRLDAAGARLEWVLTGRGAMLRADRAARRAPSPPPVPWQPLHTDLRPIPFHGVEAAAGAGLIPIEATPHPTLAVDPGWLRQTHGIRASEALKALTVRGTSMEPTLVDGDTALFDPQQRQPVSGWVMLVRVAEPGAEAALLIKRLLRAQDGTWWATSDNPAFAPVALPPGVEDVVLGRIVGRFGRVV